MCCLDYTVFSQTSDVDCDEAQHNSRGMLVTVMCTSGTVRLTSTGVVCGCCQRIGLGFRVLHSSHACKRCSQQVSAVVQEGGADASKQVADPYANEPRRHRALKVQSDKPFNAETPLDALASGSSTPTELFYVRNHLPVPHVDPAGYSVCPRLPKLIACHCLSLLVHLH